MFVLVEICHCLKKKERNKICFLRNKGTRALVFYDKKNVVLHATFALLSLLPPLVSSFPPPTRLVSLFIVICGRLSVPLFQHLLSPLPFPHFQRQTDDNSFPFSTDIRFSSSAL